MQQVFDAGLNPFASLRTPELSPSSREDAESPLLKSGARTRSNQVPEPAAASAPSTPQIKIFPEGGMLCLRVDHPVRELLVATQKALDDFVLGNLKPHPVMGFKQQEGESVAISGIIETLKSSRSRFEAIAGDRADGFGTSLTVRSAAGEASIAIEHTLIDLVTASSGESLSVTEVAPFMHALTNLKHGLRQLLNQFDSSMLEFVNQSGVLARMLGDESSGKGATKSKRGS